MRLRLVHGFAALALAVAANGLAQEASERPPHNGFVLAPISVAVQEILPGGPPRDGIPALMDPAALPAAKAPWPDDEVVIGIERGGATRAYPIAILNWHEVVNDTLGGDPIVVSYSALCGTGIVFDRRVGPRVFSFGVSGLLYRSDLLLYDRETQSLWSQIAASAISGPSNGSRLRVLRSLQTTWGDWKTAHPKTSVLSPATGHERDYGRSPYAGYATSEELRFPVPLDERYHPKMPTLGLRLPGGPARAYPASELVAAGGRADEELAGRHVIVAYDPERQLFDVEAPPEVEVIEGFWFAWAAFHPETSVFTAP